MSPRANTRIRQEYESFVLLGWEGIPGPLIAFHVEDDSKIIRQNLVKFAKSQNINISLFFLFKASISLSFITLDPQLLTTNSNVFPTHSFA